ncbi:MAG: hypothetical protein N4A45_03330 [Flavobacteriales bacterium]|jgi:hypothetical protein|nr:hypothetical protein [Flavobacteriales bacterium]
MIRVTEAISMLKTSAPTFYKRIKKEGIQLHSKMNKNGKGSYILLNDLELLANRMGKKLDDDNEEEEESQLDEKTKQSTKSIEENQMLLKENYELQIQNKTLE